MHTKHGENLSTHSKNNLNCGWRMKEPVDLVGIKFIISLRLQYRYEIGLWCLNHKHPTILYEATITNH